MLLFNKTIYDKCVIPGDVAFDIGPMKEVLRKINVKSSFDEPEGYSMESFDEAPLTLEGRIRIFVNQIFKLGARFGYSARGKGTLYR